jgi:hypothetical protein
MVLLRADPPARAVAAAADDHPELADLGQWSARQWPGHAVAEPPRLHRRSNVIMVGGCRSDLNDRGYHPGQAEFGVTDRNLFEPRPELDDG